jgi:flagellar biosynthesis protein FlhF
MRIRKFEGADMREALALVKREFGPDAMVVATRQIRRGLMGTGVEVTAAVEDDGAASPPAAAYGPTPAFVAAGAGAADAPRAHAGAPGAVLSDGDVERIMAPLRSELRSLRSLVRGLGEDPSGHELRAELAALRQALHGLGARPAAAPLPPLAEVARGARLAAPSERRVIALVGQTGVGKTTTIAKLAARAALVEHRQVAIISLDTFRVGGEEQMRTFADLIGVPLSLCTTREQLLTALAARRRCDRVYIDTAGRSPRDAGAQHELEELLGGVDGLELHLCLPAAASAGAIDRAFARHERLGVDRLLFTKLDEADDLAQLVRAPARLARPIAHVTTGQRVPEDLEDATIERLLALASGGLGGAELAA